jgi:hypothetical protein
LWRCVANRSPFFSRFSAERKGTVPSGGDQTVLEAKPVALKVKFLTFMLFVAIFRVKRQPTSISAVAYMFAAICACALLGWYFFAGRHHNLGGAKILFFEKNHARLWWIANRHARPTQFGAAFAPPGDVWSMRGWKMHSRFQTIFYVLSEINALS